MKIKLAVLEKDSNYLRRFVSVFGTKYSDRFEIYSFTDEDMAYAVFESTKIDIFLAGDIFEIDTNRIPSRCGIAYCVDSMDVETVNGKRAICKFQKLDMIFKQILSVYSEQAGNISGIKVSDNQAKIIAFQPASGGCGASTMAASCAMHYAKKGSRVLYLNLEKYGSSDCFFTAEGPFDMSDIIYALKSKKTNIALKLESCVKQDASGVFFFSQSKIALDMLEINEDDIIHLLSEIQLTASYDIIVLDLDFSIDNEVLKVFNHVESIVWIGDGSEISNAKMFRALTALNIVTQKSDDHLMEKLSIAYNKFSNKTSMTLDDLGVRNIGGCPRYEHATVEMILRKLSSLDLFDKI